ncbi:hypothetical protein [Blastopirellula marina]|uniref:hypothetical protein n=1 Tax=Blastopirellula marina TaxID=124 RepID=UPI00130484F6|nr:hypothetical protein [Blastopirellula marina]
MSRSILPVIVAVWIGLVGIGFVAMLIYQHKPGQSSETAAHWPTTTHLPLDPARCNLLVFLHPRCACSLASLNELARIQARCQDRLAIQILMYHPAGADADWFDSPIVDLAKQIPGAKRVLDQDGLEATRFGATTSGQVILFAPNGERVFTGGITHSRAHEGDNLGRQTVENYVCRGEISVDHTKPFGCPLLALEPKAPSEPRTPHDGVE